MASRETLTTMNSFFKEIYAPKIQNLIPDHEMLLKEIPFMMAGGGSSYGEFVEPVILTRDHGISFLGNDTNTTLADPVVSVKKDARIVAAGKAMRTQITDMAASRAATNKQAFISAVNHAVKSLTESFACIQESSHWYGDGGYGRFTAATADLSATKITFTAPQFAPGLWIGGEGMPIDIYSVTGSTELTKVPNALVLSTTVSAVDMANRKLTLASVAGLSDSTEYIVLRKGAYGYESKGLFQILKNSGSLFNISAATYPLWAANQYNANGSLNYTKISDAVSLAMGRGLRGPIDLVVHSTVFRHLFPDFLTVKDTSRTDFQGRSFDAASARNLEHGTDKVTFYINGVQVNVRSNEYCLPAYGAGIAMKEFSRVGSSQIRAGMPSSDEDAFFPLESTAASEYRMFSDQALFTSAPSRSLLIYGVS